VRGSCRKPGGLLILAAGITGLQVAANPYVDLLGKLETASSRLDLTPAFNSLGTTIAPKIGELLILSAAPLAIEQLRRLPPQALHASTCNKPLPSSCLTQ
jgi:MFS transporter, FHS family, L-fucose permease